MYVSEFKSYISTDSLSEVYRLWLTGVQMVIEGSVLTYIDNDGFKCVNMYIPKM